MQVIESGNPSSEVQMAEIDLAEQIGRGGYGAVYKGSWRGAQVAVKYIICDVADADAVYQTVREVVLSKKMSHPNVVQTYGFTMAARSDLDCDIEVSAAVLPTEFDLAVLEPSPVHLAIFHHGPMLKVQKHLSVACNVIGML